MLHKHLSEKNRNNQPGGGCDEAAGLFCFIFGRKTNNLCDEGEGESV